MEIYILGSSAAVPTGNRNLPSILINYKGDRILFDCGEGTQKTIMANSLGLMKISKIFITHWHADHFSGLIGLIQTMGVEKRKKDLYIYGPEGTENYVNMLLSIGKYRRKYEIIAKDLKEGDFIEGRVHHHSYKIYPFKTKHDIESLGYAFIEDEEFKANREKMKKIGLKSSPLIRKLKEGKEIEFKGKIVRPEDVIDLVRGRKVVYTGDTEYSENTIKWAKDSDILIHESTFSEENRKGRKNHSTAREAGIIAKKAGVKKLILTHIGRKYDKNPEHLLKEAKEVFENTLIAEDMLKIELKPHRPEQI